MTGRDWFGSNEFGSFGFEGLLLLVKFEFELGLLGSEELFLLGSESFCKLGSFGSYGEGWFGSLELGSLKFI